MSKKLKREELHTSEAWTVDPWEQVEGGEFTGILMLQKSIAPDLPAPDIFILTSPAWVEHTAPVKTFFMFVELFQACFSIREFQFLLNPGVSYWRDYECRAHFSYLNFTAEKMCWICEHSSSFLLLFLLSTAFYSEAASRAPFAQRACPMRDTFPFQVITVTHPCLGHAKPSL